MSWQANREAAKLMHVLAEEQNRIAVRLSQLRQAHALTQEDCAQRIDVTLRQWQRWESGESTPYARNIARISEVFGVPLSELVGSEPAPEPSQLDRIESQLAQIAERLQMLEEIKDLTRTAERLLDERSKDVAQRAAESPRTEGPSDQAPSAA